MWTYTSYILFKLFEKKTETRQLTFEEVADFVFKVLWRKEKLAFHEDRNDLLGDLQYLEKMGIITLQKTDGKTIIQIKDKKRLEEAVEIVENAGTLTGVKLLDTYVERINRAIEQLVK